MTLGQQLRQLREARGMTQNDLAARFDLTQNAIKDLEHDKFAGVYLSQLQKMCDYFSCALIMYPREAPSGGQKKVNSKNV